MVNEELPYDETSSSTTTEQTTSTLNMEPAKTDSTPTTTYQSSTTGIRKSSLANHA